MPRFMFARSFTSRRIAAVALCLAFSAGYLRAAVNPLDHAPHAPVNPLDNPWAKPPAENGPVKAAGGAAIQRFERYTLMDDPTYIGGPVSTFLIPAGWKVDGSVHWDMVSTFPAQAKVYVYDPKSPAAFALLPGLLFDWQTDRNNGLGYHPPLGSKYAGGIVRAPVDDAFTAIMEVVIPTYRKELQNAKAIDKEKLPKLAKDVFEHTYGLPGQQQSVMAGRIRFEYQINGQAVEEDVIAALVLRPQPRFKTIEWRVVSIVCTRGPKGTLDDVKMDRLVMQRSTVQDIHWFNKLCQFSESANRAKIAEIRATAERSRIFAQMTNDINDARKKQFEDHIRDIGARALVVDQYIRDVTPYNTTQGPPVELPSGWNHNWQGAGGQIIQTNDANYNPNSDPNNTNTGWTEMKQASR